jgi:hypothetical protein
MQLPIISIHIMAAQERTHSLIIYIKTGGRRGRFEHLAPAGVEAAGTGDPGSGSAGTSGTLRSGAVAKKK